MRQADRKTDRFGCIDLFLALFGLFWIGMTQAVQAADRNAIEPFEVGYEVYRNGIAVGEAVLRFELQGKDRYRMRSKLRLTGLVRLVSEEGVYP